MHIIEKKQPIPLGLIERLQEFVQNLADKDIQSFGICYVSRYGKVHSFHHEGEREYALQNAVEYLLSGVKAGGYV